MLDISSTLLDKVKSSLQTIGNNADPKMEIIAQKATRYLNQGSFLTPKTVRTWNSLGRLDICVRRADYAKEPTEIIMVYIQDGIAKVATLPYVSKPTQNFVYKYTIGPATDVACDFNGVWKVITRADRAGLYFDTDTVWALQTSGEPYFAIVNTSGVLSVRKGQGAPFDLATGVTNCAIHRGWKSVTDILTDEGVICAYIKSDTKAYYRNYCEQENGTFVWEYEREFTDFPPPVSNLSIFRCADYRTGFLAEISGIMHLMVTTRSWSGMAILPEYLIAKATAMTVNVIELNYQDNMAPDEYITATVSGITIQPKYALSPVMKSAYNAVYTNTELEVENDYGYKVVIEFNEIVDNVSASYNSFVLEDSMGQAVYPFAAESITGRTIAVYFMNFNNAVGEVTVSYNGTGLVGEIGQNVDADSVSFTPTGLVPFYVAPPVVVGITNIQDWEVPS